MNPLFLLSGVGMMAVALAAVLYWKQRSKAASTIFLWGALAWIAGTVLKSVASIPTPTIIDSLRANLPRYFSEPILWLYIGLLTGIFECGATLGFAHIKRIRATDWKEAVGFGLGFGAVEAFLLGVSSFLIVFLVILIPDKLPPELVQFATSGSASLLAIPTPIIERIVVVLVHAFSCVLIIHAVRTGEWKWFWISFFYKTAIDAIAGYFQITYGVQNLTTLGAWVVEMILLPFGIVGFLGLRKFRRRW